MITFPVLSLIIFLPLLGALLMFCVRGDEKSVTDNVKSIALVTTLVVFALSVYMFTGFDKSSADFQFVEKFDWLPALGSSYKMGVDGISIFFVLLSTLLTPICILASWESIKKRVREYMMAFLLLETMMIGMFCALDFVLFYVFFEGVLLPMFFIIGVWGGERRVYAAFKFFLYTLLGSVLMLLAILLIYHQSGTMDIPTLMQASLPPGIQKWLWLAFMVSFAVKIPMWPVHTWLPDAHVEAPTAGSVILAGILLKMGGYGFLRISLPMLPEASEYFIPLIFSLSVIAVIYTSLVALVQEDIKKLIAYSSVANMGFVTIGIFSVTTQGMQGAMFQMLSHGIVVSALFLCVGVVYDRLHTLEIARYGGLVNNMPRYATVFMIFMLASIGLPGTSGFVGEFLVLIGVYQVSTLVAFLTATGVILGAAYMLYLYKRVVFGELTKADVRAMTDINAREVAIFVPLIALVFWMGIYPSSFINPMAPAIEKVITRYNDANAISIPQGAYP
ncbi:MAG: NADH-quinone oxidoreductase subunit M [Alphaproteobacteria bacterium]|nr:NADH-quinone oxidoreductase subunit M [Alphaproteobacteria bacterium]